VSELSDKMKQWIEQQNVDAEILGFEESVRSVQEAVAVSGYPIERFTKSIVMLTSDERLVIALVPADARGSTERVRKALGLIDRPRIVTALFLVFCQTLKKRKESQNDSRDVDTDQRISGPEIYAASTQLER
jgi:hypothetical protein